MARAVYNDGVYLANRRRLLDGSPRCHWCKTAPATCADHVIPVADGGTSEFENLVASCQSCNSRRGAQLGNARLRALQRRRFEQAVRAEVARRLAHPDAPGVTICWTGKGRPAVGVASQTY